MKDADNTVPVLNNSSVTKGVSPSDDQYFRLQDLMIKISSTYINIELERVEEVIQQSLQEMSEFVNADRAYIFDYDFDANVCNNTYEWCREGISAEINNLQNVPLEFIPNWVDIHRRGEAFYMPDIYLLPMNGPYSVRGLLEPQGVKSLITLPMKLKDELVGFVGFDSVRDFHVYSERERDLLVVFSQMLVNIAERKRQSEALILAKNIAEEASKTKEIFLSTMSHEIRTPLNVINGMVREMLRQDLSPSQYVLMSNAKSAAVHLLSILNNILDLSKIEAGEFSLDQVVFDFKALLADANAIMNLRAKEKQLDLIMTIDPEMETVFFGDEARIRQVLINLIDNAVKFTDAGQVSVNVWPGNVRDDKQEVHVEVKDTGIGIHPDFLLKIFSKFSQEHTDTRRKYQGTGLGLNIVQNLVQMMDGEIEVKSRPGEGSEFHFYVLLTPASPQLLPVRHYKPDETVDRRGKRILIVEDNELNRFVVFLSLKALNCTVVEAENGKIAIDILQKEAFDLIIMDVQMPVMDGLEATHIIRKQMNLTTPIIALTANAFKQNIDQYLEAGMDDYIVKPYLEKDFMKIIAKFLPAGKPESAFSEGSLYDINQLREVCKNDEQLMQKMMRIFIRVVEDAVPRFEQFRAEGDLEGISKLAHKLKPSIDHLAVEPVIDKIRLLEKSGSQQLATDDFFRLMDEVIFIIKKVAAQLAVYLETSSK